MPTIDDLLERGFFRSGHSMRQTRYVYVDRKTYSTIWSRVPLQTFSYTKSQRKRLRRCLSEFDISIAPYQALRDQDELYDIYQAAHPLDVGESVTDILGHHRPLLDFDTHTLRIERHGRLVAFSCFDRGESVLASVFGCYDPRLPKESLGFATMLLELDYGRRNGYSYYYPGYCVPGLSAFSYKLRLPDLEGRTYAMPTWQKMSDVLELQLPKVQLERVFAHLMSLLEPLDYDLQLRYMPLSEVVPSTAASPGPLPHQIMVEIKHSLPLGQVFVGYNLEKSEYELWLASTQIDLAEDPLMAPLFEELPENSDLRLFTWRIQVYTTTDVSSLLKYLNPGSLLSGTLFSVG